MVTAELLVLDAVGSILERQTRNVSIHDTVGVGRRLLFFVAEFIVVGALTSIGRREHYAFFFESA